MLQDPECVSLARLVMLEFWDRYVFANSWQLWCWKLPEIEASNLFRWQDTLRIWNINKLFDLCQLPTVFSTILWPSMTAWQNEAALNHSEAQYGQDSQRQLKFGSHQQSTAVHPGKLNGWNPKQTEVCLVTDVFPKSIGVIFSFQPVIFRGVVTTRIWVKTPARALAHFFVFALQIPATCGTLEDWIW